MLDKVSSTYPGTLRAAAAKEPRHFRWKLKESPPFQVYFLLHSPSSISDFSLISLLKDQCILV